MLFVGKKVLHRLFKDFIIVFKIFKLNLLG